MLHTHCFGPVTGMCTPVLGASSPGKLPKHNGHWGTPFDQGEREPSQMGAAVDAQAQRPVPLPVAPVAALSPAAPVLELPGTRRCASGGNNVQKAPEAGCGNSVCSRRAMPLHPSGANFILRAYRGPPAAQTGPCSSATVENNTRDRADHLRLANAPTLAAISRRQRAARCAQLVWLSVAGLPAAGLPAEWQGCPRNGRAAPGIAVLQNSVVPGLLRAET